MRAFFTMIFCLAWAAPVAAEVEVRSLGDGETSPPARIEALSWLAGYWVGEGLGGEAAEVIAPAADGRMMGAFRHHKADGALNFYEFYVFEERGESLVLRLKHFTPDLVGWEEKDGYVEFPLVAVEAGVAYFDGITYALSGEDGLVSAVMLGEEGVAEFRYTRTAITP